MSKNPAIVIWKALLYKDQISLQSENSLTLSIWTKITVLHCDSDDV